MRDIKFRAWRQDQTIYSPETYLMDYSLVIQDGKACSFDPEDGRLCEEDWELMQYTGLHDKNGVEIYEGDIIEYPYREKTDLAVVVWGYDGWICKPKAATQKRLAEFVWNSSPEFDCWIIGNIHENKELLNEVQ